MCPDEQLSGASHTVSGKSCSPLRRVPSPGVAGLGTEVIASESKPAQVTRRGFLGIVSLAGAALTTGETLSAIDGSEESPPGQANQPIPIHFFSKPLDQFETEFMVDTLAAAGVNGIDVTVRPRGRVVPERVETDLPRFVETVHGCNLTVKMMVTALTRPDSPHAESVIKSASQSGIEHYRLGYLDYDFRIGISESLAEHNVALQELAALNRTYRIQAGYQNHAGRSVGAPVWDLPVLLKNIAPDEVGVQYDIRHAVAEGAASWVVGMRLVNAQIASLAIKDCMWDLSSRRPRLVDVPLGEGFVDFDAYFKLVKELDLHVPITLHIEYPVLSQTDEGLPLLQQQRLLVAKISKDVEFLRSQLLKYQIRAQ